MHLQNEVGYVIEGEKGYFLCHSGFWCHVPIATAWVHPKSSIVRTWEEFSRLNKEFLPQFVYEAFSSEGKTELLTGIEIPFDSAINNLLAPA